MSPPLSWVDKNEVITKNYDQNYGLLYDNLGAGSLACLMYSYMPCL